MLLLLESHKMAFITIKHCYIKIGNRQYIFISTEKYKSLSTRGCHPHHQTCHHCQSLRCFTRSVRLPSWEQSRELTSKLPAKAVTATSPCSHPPLPRHLHRATPNLSEPAASIWPGLKVARPLRRNEKGEFTSLLMLHTVFESPTRRRCWSAPCPLW